ncbi:hypothetical protein [Neisseria wadsworthii]|uniref:Uncharacterized protein n=1 Tax=Neisseria wadsworthii 9715 TaxID=1030841 RepID=G4CSS6_9NEIS|nr:hypothetical protein [Neisseria wadsworthii]EGZ44632.1 hypothetical protein HMPREF9370_2158 [Neisseria wadsworthii 9715]QMT35766.1 hypothetical protein H3L96_00345 [Neisseria wadsworthii]
MPPANRKNLREQMVIKRARSKNRSISAKSLLIFAITWALWLAAVYFVFNDHEALIFEPIIGTWTLIDLIKAVAVVTLTQLNILFCWSILATSRVSALRNKRRTAARIKTAVETTRQYRKIDEPPANRNLKK